jgi:hypothetical protein
MSRWLLVSITIWHPRWLAGIPVGVAKGGFTQPAGGSCRVAWSVRLSVSGPWDLSVFLSDRGRYIGGQDYNAIVIK